VYDVNGKNRNGKCNELKEKKEKGRGEKIKMEEKKTRREEKGK